MQQNSKCRLFGERDEMIDHIVNKYNKQAQKEYKTLHNWLGKMQKIKFWPYYQMVYAQTRTCPRKSDA